MITDELDATVVAVRNPWARASLSTVNVTEPARANGERLAETALEDTDDESLPTPLVMTELAIDFSESRLERNRRQGVVLELAPSAGGSEAA